jgi:TIR domain
MQAALEEVGIQVWRDTGDLRAGQDWRMEIRNAITSGSLAFIACFSNNSTRKGVSFQNDELIIAIEEMRRRPPGHAWIVPVRFSDCEIPKFDLGANRTLDSLHRVDYFDEPPQSSAFHLIGAIFNILHQRISMYSSPPELIGEVVTPNPPDENLTVRPKFIDLGSMQQSGIYHAFIEVDTGADNDHSWGYEVSGDPIEATRHDRGIILSVTLHPGEFHSAVTVKSRDGESRVAVSGNITPQSAGLEGDLLAASLARASADSAPGITPDEARAALRDWLSEQPELPEDLFDGDLEIVNATSIRARVSHVFEVRQEATFEALNPPANTYEEIDHVRMPIRWKDQAWIGLLPGSKSQIPCKQCKEKGTVPCVQCSGQGGQNCSPTASCTSCSGTGVQASSASSSTKCWSCRGAGFAKCRKCDGAGRIECAKCKGYGALRCSHCQGSGEVTRYVQGSVTHSLKEDVIRTGETDASVLAVINAREADYEAMALTKELVGKLPAGHQTFLSEELSKPPKPGELARSAQLDLLQAASIRYRYGDFYGSAQLVGPAWRLHIPLTSKERRRLRVIHAGGRYNLYKGSLNKAAGSIRSSASAGVSGVRRRLAKRPKELE